MPGLAIRKLADTSSGTRVRRYDPQTGEAFLLNPETDQPVPWPLAGVEPVGDLPDECTVSTRFVADAKAEGWLSLEGERVVHRPGGPPQNLWAVTHTFVHADAVTFHFVDEDVRYRVVHQPDKYAGPGDDETEVTAEVYAAGETRVDWFYGLEREG